MSSRNVRLDLSDSYGELRLTQICKQLSLLFSQQAFKPITFCNITYLVAAVELLLTGRIVEVHFKLLLNGTI
ncbi:hypothetical protein HW132_33075 [Brasilonema sp. CT11]|nr:hypothetical protein [Brasilonema sp. CT11]